ncbi:PLP-dependent aspartate aminotransferase family protein [Pelagibacteraceae bacterium]|nr:PLP-dependent aspartate aminotransferase family protein [Pelagibacteraceae bacterium]
MNTNNKKFNSKVIHSGHEADESTGAVMPPIHLSSTFKQKSPGDFKYEYARTGNPTRDILEKLLREIENGKFGFAFSSGMAAISALSDALGNNYSIISSDDVYGGTRRIFDKIKSINQNIDVTYVDLSKDNNWQGHVKENTKMIWLETPSNPLLKVIDIKKIKESLNNQDIIIVCDNTFASPYNQQPINYGADVTIHSSTKYLGGHSDIIGGGLVINNNPKLAEKIKYIQNAVGAVPSPFDCYLLIRSIKTLAVRMERHNSNALEIAKFLSEHSKVKKVFYPGLENDSSNQVAKKQMKGFGGILSIDLKGDINSAKKFLENIKIFTLAESLGGVESLIEHPAIMTHASIDKKIRDELGISDTLIRLSIGIEDIEDLKNALNDALNKI